MANTKKLTDIHLYVPNEEYARWEEEKHIKFNGARAMSLMIRNYVNEGIERDRKKRAKDATR